ncbi:ABC transporter ATP-binding protein [Cryobacterium melibiosiphilum]|uniref:ABC transporter ATP-binding protein n=1 Tax=Cryobacterium melibiosiphilum TaxID=995039 RepID=A0A3A5MBE3_9MICO|nr:ABC transporter ATP-binding protein [Cryobacterium melibiosiphilum]RJT85659.1 ABC transporter ATP-binding protein [Cryobacterium melibiosiphilum]
MSVVSVRDLCVTLAGTTIVDGVSFSIEAGRCLGIVGESGAGKTVTARSLLGLAPAGAIVTATELSVAGVDARALTEAQWRAVRGARVGLVSQDALVSLDPLRRVGAEVIEPLAIHESGLGRVERQQRMLRLLEQVALPEPAVRARDYPHELSGGLRQRALIASALAATPALLVADEPTTALDATVQAQVIALLHDLKRQGLALLLISHDLNVIRALADDIAVMKDGRFVEVAPTAALLAAPQHPYTRELLAAAALDRAPESAPAGPVVLAARDLGRTYRTPGRFRGGTARQAVTGVSFDLLAGHTLGIVGESGSGKSTLARMLLGIEKPDSGVVLLHGEPWSALPESQRRARRGQIQLIHQDSVSAFDPRFTVLQILSEAIAVDGTPRRARRARAAALLQRVALPEALLPRRAHELSGGQRQRVAIARALARAPRVLVCDEPVSALDVSIQAQVLDLLGELQRETGLALVFISHDLAVVRALSHDILVMKDGVVVEQGGAAAVLDAPEHPFTRALLAAGPGPSSAGDTHPR